MTLQNNTHQTRSRRLRKKLHVGEFQEFGFTLSFTIDLQQKSFDDALDDWIDYVESQGWGFYGGGDVTGNEIAGFLCQYDGGSLTESDRELVACQLAIHPPLGHCAPPCPAERPLVRPLGGISDRSVHPDVIRLRSKGNAHER